MLMKLHTTFAKFGILVFSCIVPMNFILAQTPTPDILIKGTEINTNLGRSVACAGDVNGDGYTDIISGAKNGLTKGRIYIYHGSATGIDTIPDKMITNTQEGCEFGWDVAGAGDVNGDGYDDIIVGAYKYDNVELEEGRAYVYKGSPTGIVSVPLAILESNQEFAYFGYAVNGAGDVNNDGYDDVMVGAWRYDHGQEGEGRVFIYYGAATGISTTPSKTLENNQINSRFGISLAPAGDVNNDGFDDIIIGAEEFDHPENNEGRAYVYHGSASGIVEPAANTLENNQMNSYFGNTVSAAGDVNNDGYDDVIVGAYLFDNNAFDEGRIYIYLGSPTGVSNFPASYVSPLQIGTHFGNDIAAAGDVNGDGYDDVLVAAHWYTNEVSFEGAAFIYPGNATGISTTPLYSFFGEADHGDFGKSVAGIGDINADGMDDIIVGMPTYKNNLLGDGAIFIFFSPAPCTLLTYYADNDNDGFGNMLFSVEACDQPDGYVENALDCNDDNNSIHPDATEICNTIDDNCNFIIDEEIMETISISADGPTTVCQGNTVSLTAVYSGTSVQWEKNGVSIVGANASTYSANKSGNYTCVTNSFCGSAESEGLDVTINKNPNANISAGGPTTFCAGGSVILTEVAVAGCTYQWYKGATPIAGATSLTYTATTSGNYKCRVTKTGTGCYKNSNTIAVSVTCKEGETINPQTTFTIYPNPNNGAFTISDFAFVDQSCQIEIYNAIGQQIFIRKIVTTQNAIDVQLSNIASGIYIIKMRNGDNVTEQKLVIE